MNVFQAFYSLMLGISSYINIKEISLNNFSGYEVNLADYIFALPCEAIFLGVDIAVSFFWLGVWKSTINVVV